MVVLGAALASAALAGNYPDHRLPGLKPEVFGRGTVSTNAHMEFGGNFHPNGSEYYFSRREGGDGAAEILFMRLESGEWTAPITVGFSGEYFDYQPCLSRDGKKLFFGSMRPLSAGGAAETSPNIWMAKRARGGWRAPISLGPLLATGNAEFVSITTQNTLYFGEWLDGQQSNIHRSRFQGGRYREAEELPSPVNSSASDAHPLIAPDESFMIFDSTRPGGRGEGDLYLSFRREDGSWTEPASLGSRINTAAWEVNPGLSHDGRYFFFHRNGDIYWIDAKALGIYRPLLAAHSDYDGDGRSDLAVFDAGSGRWKVRGQFTRKFGVPHAIPVPGDFNGSGKTDLAYFLPKKSLWRVRGQFKIKDLGAPGDIPVPGDYDGDGATDIAFFRPYTGTWHLAGIDEFRAAGSSFELHVERSAAVDVVEIEFGQLGDIPVPADYNGDGITEIAVFRPSKRKWLIKGRRAIKFGAATDTPVPADYNGDGKTDIAVWSQRTGKWSVRGQFTRRHGSAGVIPVPGDYNGDGKADPAFFDPATRLWNVWNQFEVKHGASGDMPLVLGQ